jgi:nucleoid-associated protein YgaU
MEREWLGQSPATSARSIELEAADVRRHLISDGDTLGTIAHRYLGSAERRSDIFEYNRDVLASPEVLPIGKELRIPSARFKAQVETPSNTRSDGRMAATEPAKTATSSVHSMGLIAGKQAAVAPTGSQMYVVQPHDTLPLIARKLYGDISRQGELMAANRQQLRSPKDLRPGMTLVVPTAGSKAR